MTALRSYMPKRDFSPLKDATEDSERPQEARSLAPDEVEHLIKEAVEDARRTAFAEREAAGREVEQVSQKVAVTDALASLNQNLEEMFRREDEILDEVETRAVRLILSVTQKMAARISEAEAENYAVDIARRALEAARGSSKIAFRISEDVSDVLSGALSASLSEAVKANRVTIERDASLPAGSVHVAWDNGAVRFDPDVLKASVDKILSRTIKNIDDAQKAPEIVKEADNER